MYNEHKNILLFLISSILLIACKVNIVELDEEARAQVEALEHILTKFMEIDDFEIEDTGMGNHIILEGGMPISNKKLDATYYIHVSSSELFDGYTFYEIKTGDDFNNLSNQMSAINFMLSPDEFHPTKIKLKGKNIRVIISAIEIDSEAHLFYKDTENGKNSIEFDKS